MQANFYPLPEKYKYSAAFESPLVSLKDDKAAQYLSLASQENLQKYLPKNIDLEEKIDCLAIAGQSFLANKLNLNDDSVNAETAIRIAKLFPFSYIDANHKRDSIVGVILSASYTDPITHEELTEEQARAYTKPFAVTIGGIVWKLANKNITEALEDEANKNTLFFSWELGFTDYRLIELPKDKFDLIEGKIISDEDEIGKYNHLLRANNGTGRLENGNKLGRIIVGDCIPLGVGIVERPAGQLSPFTVQTINTETHAAELKEEDNINIDKIIDIVMKKIAEKQTKAVHSMTCPNCGEKMETEEELEDEMEMECGKCKTSHSGRKWKTGMASAEKQNLTNNKNSVIKNTINIQENKIMDKITKLTDITDESLKQISNASVIVDFVGEELRKANEKFLAEQRRVQEIEASEQNLKAQVKQITEELQSLKDAAAAREREEQYTQRMTYIDDTYELSKEERQIIAAEIKDVTNEEFDAIKSKYDILFKDKSKAAIKAKEDALKLQQQAAASVKDDEKQKIVDDALKNGDQANAGLPNAQAGQESLFEKYKEHFKPENCIVQR